MGIERWYVAIPHGDRLLEMAEKDRELGEWFGHPSIFEDGGNPKYPWDDRGYKTVCAEVRRINKGHPGISRRVYTLDRAFDTICYLISAARRRGRFDPEDMGMCAIIGAAALHAHLTGGQGHPIRYTAPPEVREIAEYLGTIDESELRREYNPQILEKQAVYKFWADRATDEYWDGICEYFVGFQNFYASVAEQRCEGVLTLVT